MENVLKKLNCYGGEREERKAEEPPHRLCNSQPSLIVLVLVF